MRSYSPSWQFVLLSTDVVMFFVSFYAAVVLVERTWGWKNYAALITSSAWLSIGLWIIIFAKLGMYRTSRAVTSRDEIYYIAAALAIGIIPQFALFTFVPEFAISRLLLFVAVGSAILIVGGSRMIIHAIARATEMRSS